MGVLENLWDDVVAGPRPDAGGRGHLRRISTGLTSLNNSGKTKYLRFDLYDDTIDRDCEINNENDKSVILLH